LVGNCRVKPFQKDESAISEADPALGKARWLTWGGRPQSLAAGYILEGATGHVDEPYLTMTPQPNLLLPAYYQGRNLAESYYLAIPALNWAEHRPGDPLCSIGKP
jgi:hypothetical protein